MPNNSHTLKQAGLLAPLCVLIALFYLIPFLGVAGWSVTLPTPGLANYERIVTDPMILSVLWRTFHVCLSVTVLALLIAYLLSYAWVFSSPSWQRVIEIFVLVPFWISVLVRAFGWIIVLRGNGLLNNWLLDFGLIDAPLRMTRNELGVIVGMTHFMIPYAIFPLVAVMRQIDRRVLMASRGLGAGRLRTFWLIFVPQTMPGVVGAFVIVFVFTLGFLITPAIIGGGRVVMIAEYIYLQMFQTSNWGLGAALSVTLLVFVCMLVWTVLRLTGVNRMVRS